MLSVIGDTFGVNIEIEEAVSINLKISTYHPFPVIVNGFQISGGFTRHPSLFFSVSDTV